MTSVTQQYHAGYKNSTNTFSYSYDHLKRADSTTVAHDGKSYSVNYRYANNLKDSAYTSNLINRKSYGTSVHESDAYKFDYVYDRVGNIKTATVTSKYDSNYVYTVRYGYDEQNQLVSERCAATNRAYVYEYDTYGNIRSKKTYTYGNYASPSDIAANCTLLSTDVYEYDDYEWFDLLTEYNNVPFSHDIIGNPLTYYNGKNYTFTWQNGRQMATAAVNGTNLSFEYDIDGLRTKKTVQNGETYNYYYSGSKLHAMTWENGAKMLSFLYDSSGAPYSMVYCYTENSVKYSASYYYVTNLQGDVIALMNANHEIVAEYLYDAWGNILSITNASGTDLSSNATHIANLNPLRYRGYVYDNETGFYYLQSRYYDPAVGRFVNQDIILVENSFLGYSLFTYCYNNPIKNIDYTGCLVCNCKYDGSMRDFRRLENNLPPYHCPHYIVTTEETIVDGVFDFGTAIGEMGVKVNTAIQSQEHSWFYTDTTTNITDNSVDVGAGLSVYDWLGAETGYSTEGHVYTQAQITPYFQTKATLGYDGAGLVYVIDLKSISIEFTSRVGLGGYLLIADPMSALSTTANTISNFVPGVIRLVAKGVN